MVVVIQGYAAFFHALGSKPSSTRFESISIPIVNTYFMCKIAGRPGWWVILMLIPIVSIIFWIIISIDIAKSFGKGTGFGIGIAFLTPIFVPILGFGSAEYQGPSA